MRWFERYAAKHKPSHRCEYGFSWILFSFFRLQVRLIVRTHSMLETQVTTYPRVYYTLQGGHLEHRRDGDKGADDYVYSDVEGQWVVHYVPPKRLRAFSRLDMHRTELFPAERLADKLLDMPEWMTANDVEFNTEKQLWLLLFTWVPEYRLIARIGE